jgi:hypothetical protein
MFLTYLFASSSRWQSYFQNHALMFFVTFNFFLVFFGRTIFLFFWGCRAFYNYRYLVHCSFLEIISTIPNFFPLVFFSFCNAAYFIATLLSGLADFGCIPNYNLDASAAWQLGLPIFQGSQVFFDAADIGLVSSASLAIDLAAQHKHFCSREYISPTVYILKLIDKDTGCFSYYIGGSTLPLARILHHSRAKWLYSVLATFEASHHALRRMLHSCEAAAHLAVAAALEVNLNRIRLAGNNGFSLNQRTCESQLVCIVSNAVAPCYVRTTRASVYSCVRLNEVLTRRGYFYNCVEKIPRVVRGRIPGLS